MEKEMLTSEDRENLVLNNIPLVHLIVGKLWNYSIVRREYLTKQDAAQHGMVHLVRASKAFDPERGFKFTTLATYYIKNGVLNDCRKWAVACRKTKILAESEIVENQSSYGAFMKKKGNVAFLDSLSPDRHSGEGYIEVENKESTAYFLGKISPHNQDIIRDCLMEGKTQAAKAKEMGVTKETICYWSRKAIGLMKEYVRNAE